MNNYFEQHSQFDGPNGESGENTDVKAAEEATAPAAAEGRK